MRVSPLSGLTTFVWIRAFQGLAPLATFYRRYAAGLPINTVHRDNQ